jgi:hypothetical protein
MFRYTLADPWSFHAYVKETDFSCIGNSPGTVALQLLYSLLHSCAKLMQNYV